MKLRQVILLGKLTALYRAVDILTENVADIDKICEEAVDESCAYKDRTVCNGTNIASAHATSIVEGINEAW